MLDAIRNAATPRASHTGISLLNSTHIMSQLDVYKTFSFSLSLLPSFSFSPSSHRTFCLAFPTFRIVLHERHRGFSAGISYSIPRRSSPLCAARDPLLSSCPLDSSLRKARIVSPLPAASPPNRHVKRPRVISLRRG